MRSQGIGGPACSTVRAGSPSASRAGATSTICGFDSTIRWSDSWLAASIRRVKSGSPAMALRIATSSRSPSAGGRQSISITGTDWRRSASAKPPTPAQITRGSLWNRDGVLIVCRISVMHSFHLFFVLRSTFFLSSDRLGRVMNRATRDQCVANKAIVSGLLDQWIELILGQVGSHSQGDLPEAERLHILFSADIQRQLGDLNPALPGDMRDRQAHTGSDGGEQQLGRHRASILAAVLRRFIAPHEMHIAHVDLCAVPPHPLYAYPSLAIHAAAPAPRGVPAISGPNERKTGSRAAV